MSPFNQHSTITVQYNISQNCDFNLLKTWYIDQKIYFVFKKSNSSGLEYTLVLPRLDHANDQMFFFHRTIR